MIILFILMFILWQQQLYIYTSIYKIGEVNCTPEPSGAYHILYRKVKYFLHISKQFLPFLYESSNNYFE